VARIDAETLVDAVNDTSGAGLRLIGSAGQGEVGAGFVEWPDGRQAVITRSGASLAALQRTEAVLARAAEAALPVPRYELIVDLGQDRAIVQQRLPGAPAAVITAVLIEQMVDVVDRCIGLAVAEFGELLDPVELYLTSSGPGFCLHQTLRVYDDRTRRLLGRINEIGRHDDGRRGDDLVHLDFHPENLLTVDGRLTGIVDWDGIGRGDRRFALVTLLFDLAHGRRFRSGYRELNEDDLAPLTDRLAEVPTESLRPWWAHMSLRLVDWTIRHRYPTAEIEHYIDFSCRGLDRLETGGIVVA
jgi:hypothetical protein